MKHSLFIAFLSISLVSCKVSAPTFKNLGPWKISRLNGTEVTVTNVAYFYNPNTIDGMRLNQINLTVQTGGKNLGQVQTIQQGLVIPKLSDFQVPISLVINFSDLMGNLTFLMDALTGKTIDLRCVGNISIGYAAFNKSVKVDQTIPVNIKDIK